MMEEDHRPQSSRLSSSNEYDARKGGVFVVADSPNSQFSEPDSAQKPQRQWSEIWEQILRLGLGETALRAGTVLTSIILVFLVIWVMGSFYLKGDIAYQRDVPVVQAQPLPTPTPTPQMPAFNAAGADPFFNGLTRQAQIHTILPNRPRLDITEYEVQTGDTIIGIAEKFGLKPQTLLWGNYDTLADDPHRLQVGQRLRILPVDGVLHEWREGEGLNGISAYYQVSPEDIIQWPSNNLSLETIGDYSHPNIAVGTKLVVPGGSRPFISWSAPLISRKDPAKARVFGPGFCGTQYEGYVGSGAFVWPSNERWLSGYDYTPTTNHWGIDIAGKTGNPIYAADSGVVVYAGWNDYGYGNVIVIDHGNGWQTLYGHLSELYVGCGSSVSSGVQIAAMGSTGRSSGPHLHFEIMNASGVRVNPWDFVQK